VAVAGAVQWLAAANPRTREKGRAPVGQPVVIVAIVVVGLVGAMVLWRWNVRRGERRRRVDAVANFPAELSTFEEPFLAAANATGKPRGLRWIAARLNGAPLFAVDRASGELYGLVAATIRFEAIEGGGMEEVEAVGNLRDATAVFVHRGGQWTTDGRAVFNLGPAGALDHYRNSLEQYEANAAG
jgi:hypothetical protein